MMDGGSGAGLPIFDHEEDGEYHGGNAHDQHQHHEAQLAVLVQLGLELDIAATLLVSLSFMAAPPDA